MTIRSFNKTTACEKSDFSHVDIILKIITHIFNSHSLSLFMRITSSQDLKVKT